MTDPRTWRGYDHNGECLDCDEPRGGAHAEDCPAVAPMPGDEERRLLVRVFRSLSPDDRMALRGAIVTLEDDPETTEQARRFSAQWIVLLDEIDRDWALRQEMERHKRETVGRAAVPGKPSTREKGI
jgi:hypothetical protein